jgi:hypothetical protein
MIAISLEYEMKEIKLYNVKPLTCKVCGKKAKTAIKNPEHTIYTHVTLGVVIKTCYDHQKG